MKHTLYLFYFVILFVGCNSNEETPVNIEFTHKIILPHTPIVNQGRTQSCWAFSMASFFESERIRDYGDTINISAMYQVREKYLQHFNYHYYTKGKDKVRGGSLGHTFIKLYNEIGAIPAEHYIGAEPGGKMYDHTKLIETLQEYANKAVKFRNLTLYKSKADKLLDELMGKIPQTFIYKDIEYTPESFADYFNFKTENYIQLTSFSHHPFYKWITLEVPDNWEHGKFYNIPIDILENCVKTALKNGYTSVWDGDISEKGFLPKQGMAINDKTTVTQEDRQKDFDTFNTTDDHMMHIIGYANDTNGKFYYIVKNSWGKVGKYKGLLYMSEEYFRAKTVSISLNKKGIANAIPTI